MAEDLTLELSDTKANISIEEEMLAKRFEAENSQRTSILCRQAANQAVNQWLVSKMTPEQRVDHMFRNLEQQVGKEDAKKLKSKMKRQLRDQQDKE